MRKLFPAYWLNYILPILCLSMSNVYATEDSTGIGPNNTVIPNSSYILESGMLKWIALTAYTDYQLASTGVACPTPTFKPYATLTISGTSTLHTSDGIIAIATGALNGPIWLESSGNGYTVNVNIGLPNTGNSPDNPASLLYWTVYCVPASSTTPSSLFPNDGGKCGGKPCYYPTPP